MRFSNGHVYAKIYNILQKFLKNMPCLL